MTMCCDYSMDKPVRKLIIGMRAIARTFHSVAAVSLLLHGIGACSSGTQVQVAMNQDFPEPLVEKLPVKVGLFIPQEFREYHFEKRQKNAKKAEMQVDLGPAQSRMLETVLPGLFAETVMLEGVGKDELPDGLDLYVVPSVLDFQYTTPQITRMNVFEIWIKYQFDVFAGDGKAIANWQVSSYGKTPAAFMKTRKAAIEAATQYALRDCGASFVTGFAKQADIGQWLATTQPVPVVPQTLDSE